MDSVESKNNSSKASGSAITNILASTLTTKNEEEEEEEEKVITNSVNAIVIQDDDEKFVRITLKIPGLQTRRLLNLSKIPKNGRVADVDYRKNMVHLKFILNENRPDQKEYVYTSKEPFKGNIEEDKSFMKFEDNTIRWSIHKSYKWK